MKGSLSDKREQIIEGDWSYPEKDVKESIQRLKEKWRLKARRMEVMSGEVAIYELECLLEEEFGEDLI